MESVLVEAKGIANGICQILHSSDLYIIQRSVENLIDTFNNKVKINQYYLNIN